MKLGACENNLSTWEMTVVEMKTYLTWMLAIFISNSLNVQAVIMLTCFTLMITKRKKEDNC
jgi:hypothetical protein